MKKVLAISGSLRSNSSNKAFLNTIKNTCGHLAEICIYEDLAKLPIFNPDDDREPRPETVNQLRRLLKECDALVLATPEYAHGIPGGLKNLLDWVVSDPAFVGKPVGLIVGAASEGAFARESLIEVLTTMSARVVAAAITTVQGAQSRVSPDGELKDKELLTTFKQLLLNLIEDTGVTS